MSNPSETHLSTEAMSAYVDGELGAVAHERAANHIRTCFECANAVAIQRQAKDSLMHNFGDCDVPTNLMSRLGRIPFSADDADGGSAPAEHRAGPFDLPGSAAGGGGRRRGALGGFGGFGGLRGRVFKGSAAAVAVVSVVVSPTLCQQTASDARGHQMHITDVLSQHVDQDSADASR